MFHFALSKLLFMIVTVFFTPSIYSQGFDSTQPPYIEIPGYDGLTGNSARFGVRIYNLDVPSVCWLEWTSENSNIFHSSPQLVKPQNYLGLFFLHLIAFQPDLTYDIRLVLSNYRGTYYGPLTTFRTLPFGLASEPITFDAENITSTSATLRGKVRVNGSFTSARFMCRSLGNGDVAFSKAEILGREVRDVDVSYKIDGLLPNESYTFLISTTTDSLPWGTVGMDGESKTFVTSNDSTVFGIDVPIRLIDWNGALNIRNFGVHSLGTVCIDPFLGEKELPPPPPGDFETRWIYDRCSRIPAYSDYHPYFYPNQTDTFRLEMMGGYPITVTWDSLDDAFSGSVILKFPGGSIDMKAIQSHTFSEPEIVTFRIMANGPRPVAKSPKIISNQATRFGSSFIRFYGEANPNGLSTMAWFEYGTNEEYISRTDVIPVGRTVGRQNFEGLGEMLFPTGQLHYRLVVENAAGRQYGQDNILMPTDMQPSREKPLNFVLGQNYPNPFNPRTRIDLEVPFSDQARLAVYDVLGREIEVLLNKRIESGRHIVEFDGADLPSGVYYYRFTMGDRLQTKKMILLR